MSRSSFPTAKFRLGRIVLGNAAVDHLTEEEISTAIRRHQAGDWGHLREQDHVANDQALVRAERIISAYQTSQGVTFLLITEADRSVTSILLPEDY